MFTLKTAKFSMGVGLIVGLCGLCPLGADPLRPAIGPRVLPSVDEVYPLDDLTILPPLEPGGDELQPRGRDVRGVYIPLTRVARARPRQLARWIARHLNADAVILDVKDDQGRVTFTRRLPTARGWAHGGVRKMAKLVRHLKENDIYVIGRLVCFKDNLLPRRFPDTAIRTRSSGAVWRDRAGLAWVDPFSNFAHDHIVSVAKSAQALGFDEIQLDYIRFPVEPEARYAVYPNRRSLRQRHEAIAALLSKVDRALTIPLSIDVFGLTAYQMGDGDGLGQSLEHLAPYIDAISPMLYLANWPRMVWEHAKPSKTHALVHNAVVRIRQRLGERIAVRPLLQAFKFRALNYGPSFIQNQIDAAVTAGSSGYLFWNQAGNYKWVNLVWQRVDDEAKK